MEPIAGGANFHDRPVTVPAGYLVLGAGAAGMVFVNALIHNADVHVALLDRRHEAGSPRGLVGLPSVPAH